ncbi:MAG: TonB-dependent receptor [Kiloniellales bacterium]|nr:TonB-dependent receptor [Kiloniellales bacterium]
MKIRLCTWAFGVFFGLGAAGAVAPPLVAAEETAAQAFAIPAQPLSSALLAFAEQTGLEVLFDARIAAGKTAPAVRGDYTAEQALRRLLAGSGLRYRYTGANAVTLERDIAKEDEDDEDNAPLRLAPVTITASREGGALDTLSRSVTVISREELQSQELTAENTAEILSKIVPGMATSSQTLTNFGQTLRGRNVLVIVDGVPLNTTRNVSRDLFNISPSNIERIEVINGGSAAYGGGAAGGIIHITTLAAEDGPLNFETTLAGTSALSRIDSDALSGKLNQKVSGKKGKIDYLLSVSGEQTQSSFDAEGDRIPPEPSQGDLSDTTTLDLLGKVGYEFEDQRVELMASYLNAEQDTDFTSDPAVDALPPGSVKARARDGLQLDDQTSRENLILNLGYSKQDILGSTLSAQAYYRDYNTRFSPVDGRPFSSRGAIVQSFLDAQVYGGRLTIDTPLVDVIPIDANLLWGADINREESKQPVTIFDDAAFDASGGTEFIVTEKERTFVPDTTTQSYGVFGQLEAFPIDWLVLRGGVRHEWVDVSFPDFTTLGLRNRIDGGDINYSETTFNIGAVVTPFEELDIYANFAQSFELPDIGLQLRLAPADFNVDDSNLNPRITDNYEIGLRGALGGFNGNVAAFFSESDQGRVVISDDFSLAQQRTRERIYGVEASVSYDFSQDLDLSQGLRIGGSFTWLKGERKDPNSDRDIALDSFRIPPIKLTGYIEYSPYPWWNLRLQALYSGNRDDAFDDGVGFGGRKVEDYTVVDLYSAFDVGPGTLKAGVENLLNNQYHTVFGQLLRNGRNVSHVAARGATARIAYTIKW